MIIAPPNAANPNGTNSTPDPDPNQGHSPAGIPGAVPGAKWVETADDAKAADKSHDVNPHPRSSAEADADARKIQPENQTTAATQERRVVVESAPVVPAKTPQGGKAGT